MRVRYSYVLVRTRNLVLFSYGSTILYSTRTVLYDEDRPSDRIDQARCP